MRFAMLVSGLSLMMVGQLSLASGWDCFGSNYRVKVRNSTTSPRKPAVFVLSHRGEGTLISAKYEEITKENLSSSVRYSAYGQGEDLLATLTVYHLEGANSPLENGEEVDGKLRLEEREGSAKSLNMVCKRYLKGN